MFFVLIDLEPLHKVTLKDHEHFYSLLRIIKSAPFF
jgi:hypothetical protein